MVRNKAIIVAMTDKELKETKALINAEQIRRMKEEIERLGTVLREEYEKR